MSRFILFKKENIVVNVDEIITIEPYVGRTLPEGVGTPASWVILTKKGIVEVSGNRYDLDDILVATEKAEPDCYSIVGDNE